MKPIEVGITHCPIANAYNPDNNQAGFILDTARNIVIFGPYLALMSSYEACIVFGRGPVGHPYLNELVAVNNMMTFRELYGTPGRHWVSGLVLERMLQSGICPQAYITDEPDLFEALRKFIVQYPDYQYRDALEFCTSLFVDAKYIEGEGPELPQNFGLEPHIAEAMRQMSEDFGPRRGCPVGPPGEPGPRGTLKAAAPKYHNIGKSHNTRKRWPK